MQELSLDVKTHVIMTIKGSRYFISKHVFDTIVELDMDKSIELDGSWLRLSSISEILTIKKFYETFPNEKLLKTEEFFIPEKKGLSIEEMVKNNKQRSFSLLEGLRKFCVENPKSNQALMLYNKKLQKYKEE